MDVAAEKKDQPGLALTLRSVSLFIAVGVAGLSFGYVIAGWNSAAVGFVAWLACSIGLAGTSWLGRWPEDVESQMPRLLGAMFIRTGIPLAAAVLVRLAAPGWYDWGFAYYLIVFYVTTLLLDVMQVLKFLRGQP